MIGGSTDTLHNLAIGLVALALGVIAVEVAIEFDVIKWRERRDERTRRRLNNLCPHAILDGPVIRSTFVSPPVTTMYACSRCGLITHHENLVRHLLDRCGNLRLYVDGERRFQEIWVDSGVRNQRLGQKRNTDGGGIHASPLAWHPRSRSQSLRLGVATHAGLPPQRCTIQTTLRWDEFTSWALL